MGEGSPYAPTSRTSLPDYLGGGKRSAGQDDRKELEDQLQNGCFVASAFLCAGAGVSLGSRARTGT